MVEIGRLSPNKLESEECVVCLGFFDGVHLGHRRLIETGLENARERGLPCCVYTFDVPPKNMSDGTVVTREITPLPIKMDIFEEMGVDRLYIDVFSDALRGLEPRAFIEEVLHRRLRARCVVAGFHYRFGRGASGDVDMLKRICLEFGIEVIDIGAALVDGEIVSSSRIRDLICDGDMKGVAALLGRPYYIKSQVLPGLQIGRQIQVPTINQDFPPSSVIPAHGVYLTRTVVEGKPHFGITNVGKRPTIGVFDDVKVETHIFGFSQDIYGHVIQVEFLDMIRPERKFSSIEGLKEQLAIDMERAKGLSKAFEDGRGN